MNKTGIKLTLIFASSLTVMAGTMVAPALPKIAEAFQDIPNVDFYAKLILAIPALFIAVFSPLAGIIIDRLGKIRPLLITAILYALAGSAGLYLKGLFEIIASRAILGMMVPVIMTTATVLIGDYFEGEERSRFLGLQGAFMAFGGTIFITISGILADFSWRLPFAVYFSSLIVVVLGLIFLFEPQKSPKITIKEEKETTGNWSFYFIIYIATFLGMFFFYLVPTQLPFLMKLLGINSSTLGSVGLIAVTLTAAIASANYGKLSARLNYRQIYVLSFLVSGIGLGLIFFVNDLIGTAIFMGIAGIGFGLLLPNASLCLISASPPEIRGRVIGGMTSAVFLGQFFSPVLFEPIVISLGIKTAYLIGAGMSLITAAYFATKKI